MRLSVMNTLKKLLFRMVESFIVLSYDENATILSGKKISKKSHFR